MPLAKRHASSAIRPFGRLMLSCFIFILISACPSIALGSHRLADDYIRTDFTVEDGLPDNVVNTIVQTANGMLWVGTEAGLASFDGREFSPIDIRVPGSPPQGAVNAFVEGSNGDLWVGTDAGIVLIPRMTLDQVDLAKLTFYRLGSTATNKVVTLYQTREGVLWAGTDHGLFRRDAGSFVPVTQGLSISQISGASGGHLLLSTSRGLLEWDGHRVMERPGLAASLGLHDEDIFGALQDGSGTNWYCTGKGLVRQNGHAFVRMHPDNVWRTAAFRAYEDPQGSVWIASRVGLYRVAGDLLETPAPGLHARYFFAGKDGELWVGTNGYGLIHLKHRLFHMFTTADGLQNDIIMSVLSTHDGRVWVGGNCGLSVFDGKNFKAYKETDGLLNTCVWTLAEDQERSLWIGTYGGGIFRFKNDQFRQYSTAQGLVSKTVSQIIVARDGSLWIATPDGLSHRKNGHFRNYSTADGLSSNQVLSVYQDRADGIWAQTQGGIDRLSGERFVPFSPGQLKDDIFPVRLAEDSLGDLYTADSPKGISLIKDDRLIAVNEDLQVLDMAESVQHDLWFSGRNGIIRITEDKLRRTVAEQDTLLDYELFDRTDGLNSIQCSVGAPNITIAPDGKLWVATLKGLAMLDLAHLPRSGHKPEVFVGAVTVDKDKILGGRQLLLVPGTHHIELHIEAVNVAAPQKIRLQYRMDGIDANWLDADTSRTAIYSTIPPGTHDFHVRATSSDGVWDQVGIVYRVRQLPYFYQTPWFLVVIAGTVILLLSAAYLIRVRQIAQQTQMRLEGRYLERERIARELHDTLLQGFHGLMLRLNAGVELVPSAEPARAVLDDALHRADRILEEGRNKVHDLRTVSMESKTLAVEFERLANSLLLGTLTSFTIRSEGLRRILDPVAYDEILAIGREAIVNAFRHAYASNIAMELHFDPRRFMLLCRDDGRGMGTGMPEPERPVQHFGLLGMRERAQKIRGELTISSGQPKGTIVILKVPARNAYPRRRWKFRQYSPSSS
jgi:signal transduction histidine kinase/ligand-binding sensor domain-containing protein